MPAGTAVRQVRTLPTGLNDVLDQLTIAHAENLDRHGLLLGEAVSAPADAIAFAVQQQQLAAKLDNATSSAAKAAALLAKEAHQHEQIGRLAYYVAGYELAHGDPHNAPPMRELGRDHLQLAAGLYATLLEQPAPYTAPRGAHAVPEPEQPLNDNGQQPAEADNDLENEARAQYFREKEDSRALPPYTASKYHDEAGDHDGFMAWDRGYKELYNDKIEAAAEVLAGYVEASPDAALPRVIKALDSIQTEDAALLLDGIPAGFAAEIRAAKAAEQPPDLTRDYVTPATRAKVEAERGTPQADLAPDRTGREP